ncbi:MAG: M15 family metallopeptidase [Alphaproteobacteria bacterium]
MKRIDPENLVCMNDAAANGVLRVAVAYAQPDNLLFGERIYRPEAKCWLHQDLANIVLRAAQDCVNTHKLRYVLHDGLRTIDAQEAMLRTKKVKDNPRWLSERLLSMPGMGGHPRGMAVDISLETPGGNPIDMGTPFDFMARDSGPDKNPAHRKHKNLSPDVLRNRSFLEGTMVNAAAALGLPLQPLPQEWWDFRMPPDVYENYAPLSDADLPDAMRMMPGK